MYPELDTKNNAITLLTLSLRKTTLLLPTLLVVATVIYRGGKFYFSQDGTDALLGFTPI